MDQTQRNAPCPCGSGKKYKKCCMNATRRSRLAIRMPVGNKNVYIALIVIFFLGIFLRYYGFHQPHGLTFDEGLYAHLLAPQLEEDPTDYSTQIAYQRLIAQANRYIPEYLDRPLFKHPPLYCYFIAINYKFFGRSDLSAVSVSILLGSLMILAVFFLGTALYDHRVGLLSALFLCIEPVHWVCSERIWMETTLSLFMLLAVLFFVLGEKQKRYLLLSGLCIGLAMLTKYPGILPLFIIFSFVVFMDRSMLKERGFWILCTLPFLMFSPWVIWNWKAYGNFNDAFISAHSLGAHWNNAVQVISEHTSFLLGFILLIGILYILRGKISALLTNRSINQAVQKQKKTMAVTFALALIIALFTVPFLRAMMKEIFIWKNTILVGWSNPFNKGPWHFYITRLVELSPLYIFAFLSVFLLIGKDKGDKLLVWSSLWIFGAFTLLGNYQSRYILPAVPFLVILSARWQVWAYDRLSPNRSDTGKTPNLEAVKILPKILLVGIILYFTIKTLKVDSLLAIGPDFGYF